MSNEVTKIKDTTEVAKLSDSDNPFLNRAKEEGVTSGEFGRFDGNTGNFIYGPNDDRKQFEKGEQVYIDLFHAKLAYLGFDEDNKPHRGGDVLIRTGEKLVEPEPKPGVRWNKQGIAEMTLPDGSIVLFSFKADTPTRPFWRLLTAYGKAYKMHRDEDGVPMVPLVKTGSASFPIEIQEEQKDGTIRKIKTTKFREVYEIIGWISVAELTDIQQGNLDAHTEIEDDGAETIAPGVEVMAEVKTPSAVAPKQTFRKRA